ncbi:hypothetical protein E1091_17660 [Micromonospora fluostatini]|uniref:Uncharacterized protein n=1 Tax=Micromonospora fluostatini TaxID=1629071 RepID=A0ABY2DCT8_9ACTN|nr:hypothetical protein E1091_17660 [Micromonospora fluostatini]
MTEKRFDHPKGLAFVLVREVLSVSSRGVYPVRFEVTASSGYRATLPACWRDECAAGAVTACPKPADHARVDNQANREHNRTHCHGWHWPSVERFARGVLATFGSAAKTETTQRIGVRPGSLPLKAFAPLVGEVAA